MQQASRLKRKEKGHWPPVWGGQCLDLFSKEVLCTDPGAVEGGAGGAKGDKRLSGDPLTPALPREMSKEAAGWQTSRCTLKKPWRLAGAYPNLRRRQISPGSLRRP